MKLGRQRPRETGGESIVCGTLRPCVVDPMNGWKEKSPGRGRGFHYKR
jgi:hypothetical protein